ncbi:hypothetical protein CVT25_013669 [Psilocybe cyanescens]|uniref:Protein kinase domain-containing protein n=1 Tax=Psilocybe cyanescens TaxID=93625 RepID=A0A409WTG3_PSICY|nr:hypothetical protein CVT25_013669 [Psilocybe cyanescens]
MLLPLLVWNFAFQHVREVVDAFGQLIQGIRFLHKHNITHRPRQAFVLDLLKSSTLLVMGQTSPTKGLITSGELFWVEIQPFLLSRGYKLRPRYDSKWKPSWKRPWNFHKHMTECPDFISILRSNLINAIRVRDGARVVIKRVVLENDNVPVLEYLNTPEMRQDPRNNTVPLLEVIALPKRHGEVSPADDAVLLVMPMLFPFMSHILFRHVREIVEALDQLIQGLVLLHELRIAHRDACFLNFMMDPIDVIPSGFHYARNTRQPDGKSRIEYKDRCSVAPVKYYMIDYETAECFPPGVGTVGFYGQVQDIPEMSFTVPYDPFKLDVYQLGSLIRELIKRPNLIDAIRMKDGAKVVIKRVILEYDNVPILQYLNSPEMRMDSRNNAVPLLEVIPLPDTVEVDSKHSVLLVMPMLFPLMSSHLPFRHAKEVVDALDQLIQGIQFLHEHNIAHRDACSLNFMMDPTDVIPSSFHHAEDFYQPDGKTRIDFRDRCSVAPVQYYIIDYETADYFPPTTLCVGFYGQERDVPELSHTAPYDPFKLDIYQLGTLVRMFVEKYKGLDFLEPLGVAMTFHNPEVRLTATKSLERLQLVVSSLKETDLSREIWLRNSTPSLRVIQTVPPDVKAGSHCLFSHIMRVYDGVRVVIKRVVLENDNVPILEYLNTPDMLEDPRNNTVPLLDVLPLPDNIELPSKKESVLLVMPMFFPLMSRYLPFLHVKEVLDALNQLIQGIQFLHEHNIAHRDACLLNFMMDPIDVIPSGFHYTDNYYQPDGKTRIEYIDRCSAAPIKYYLIDYETADYFDTGEQCVGFYGQVKNVPGTSLTIPYDPFKLDVYQLGDVVRRFTEEYEGLDFLETLSKVMTDHDPEMRPTAAGALQLFRHLVSSFGPTDLSQEIWLRETTIEERKAQNMPPNVNNGFIKSCLRMCMKRVTLLFCSIILSRKVVS